MPHKWGVALCGRRENPLSAQYLTEGSEAAPLRDATYRLTHFFPGPSAGHALQHGQRVHLSDVPGSQAMALEGHGLEVAEKRARMGEGPRRSVKPVRKGLSMLAAVVGTSLHEHPADDKLQMNVFHHPRRTYVGHRPVRHPGAAAGRGLIDVFGLDGCVFGAPRQDVLANAAEYDRGP